MKFVSLGFIGHNFGDYKNEGQIIDFLERGFIGHNFGDYKNRIVPGASVELVLSATILETTKTSNSSSLQDPRRAHTLRSKV